MGNDNAPNNQPERIARTRDVVVERGELGAEARFSPCRRYRYSLRRFVPPDPAPLFARNWYRETIERATWRRVCFIMLNPSTADAFKLDPTVAKCVAFARRWGYEVLDVVNLYALRTPHPRELSAARPAERGADAVNDAHVRGLAGTAELTIAAWGNPGQSKRLGTRGPVVRELLESEGVELHILGRTASGAPTHPLARGRGFVPLTTEPQRWTP